MDVSGSSVCAKILRGNLSSTRLLLDPSQSWRRQELEANLFKPWIRLSIPSATISLSFRECSTKVLP